MLLSISVAPGSPIPLFQQIVNQVNAAVASGALAEGDALPPVRTLALRLRVNHNTVVKAYSELVNAGTIESRGTTGMFVRRRKLFSRPERRRRVEPSLDVYVSEALLLGFTKKEILAQVEDRVDALSPDD
jgi:GntR family transcriptional regulator